MSDESTDEEGKGAKKAKISVEEINRVRFCHPLVQPRRRLAQHHFDHSFPSFAGASHDRAMPSVVHESE